MDSVLFRDVIERYKVMQVEALRWLVRQCLRNPAGSMSVHRLHLDLRAQGHGVAKDAVPALRAATRTCATAGAGVQGTRGSGG